MLKTLLKLNKNMYSRIFLNGPKTLTDTPLIPQSSAGVMKSQLLPDNNALATGDAVPSGLMGQWHKQLCLLP